MGRGVFWWERGFRPQCGREGAGRGEEIREEEGGL